MPTTRSKQYAGPTVEDDSSNDGADPPSDAEFDRDDENSSAVDVKQNDEEEPDGLISKPKDQSLEILSDLVEYEAEMMFWDRDKRVQHWQSLGFFWKSHPASNHKFGRLYIRNLLADLLFAACSKKPYGDSPGDEEDNDDSDEDKVTPTPMIAWDRPTWETMQVGLTEARNQCLRKDSDHTWNWTLTEADVRKFQNPDKNKKRSKSDLFKKKYNVVMKLLEIQKVLAPIRERLEAAIEQGQKGKIKISQGELNEILDYAEETEYHGVEEIIGALFEEDKTLKTVEDLEPILTASPFDLAKCQNKLEYMLQKWSREVFRVDPELVKLKYKVDRSSTTMQALKLTPAARSSLSPTKKPGTESPARSQTKSRRSASQAELDELRRGRAALNNLHGADRLESSQKAAQGTVGAAKRRRDDEDQDSDSSGEDEDHPKKRARGSEFYEKKKSAKTLVFMDDIEADDEEEERERVELSDTPSKSYRFPRSYRGLMPEEGLFDEDGKVTKRRVWLPEEKDAIKAGMEKIGWDSHYRWVKIKQMYEEILRNRTAVQIKDCWRTMVKNGEVEQPDEEM